MNELDQLRAEADQLKNAIRVSTNAAVPSYGVSTLVCWFANYAMDMKMKNLV